MLLSEHNYTDMASSENILDIRDQYFDIKTPPGDILEDNHSVETQYEHLWSAEELATLKEHYDYHNAMMQYIHTLSLEGPTGDQLLPKPPKRKIQALLKEQKNTPKLTGMKY